MNIWPRSAQHMFVCVIALFLLLAVGCQEPDDGAGGEATAVAEAPTQENAAPDPAETSPTAVPTEKPLTEPPPTATPEPTLESSPTPEPTETPTPEATATPTPTPEPTATPSPIPSPTPEPLPDADWMLYLNQFRDLAGLPRLHEDTELSRASRSHAVYIVRSDIPAAHSESPDSPHYTPEGASVAPKANLFATTQLDGEYDWAIGFWLSAPFHILQVIDPELSVVGYGQHNEAVGNIHMAGVLEVALGPRLEPSPDIYPLFFPKDGGQTWIVRKSMYEWPEPYGRCPGYSYQPPSGPTIVVQLGDGSLTPNVTSHRFLKGDQVIQSCVFDETTFEHPDPYTQAHGRAILDDRDAVILIPLEPLEHGQTYTAVIAANGETYEWSFSVGNRPPLRE